MKHVINKRNVFNPNQQAIYGTSRGPSWCGRQQSDEDKIIEAFGGVASTTSDQWSQLHRKPAMRKEGNNMNRRNALTGGVGWEGHGKGVRASIDYCED
ncbi:hypothetical protein SESBI_01723 [Sesbania bispinosa]|nr:hypothetical protein SESBI_01723 [Sesbania bispinosa]